MGSIQERALKLHKELVGKLEVISKAELDSADDLSLLYTPGVAEPCKVIAENPDAAFDYTGRGNMVAVVSDGTAVLGLGDIGPLAALPVMEGKCVLFKKFGGVNAFPICLNTKDVDEIVRVVKALEPSFGGINLEDISAPRCFEIEARLKKETNIPIFHDDQHGTAIVVLAALINALKVVNKKIDEIKLVLNGAGSAGIAITKLLLQAGLKNSIMVDRAGMLCTGEPWMNPAQKEMAELTNHAKLKGSLADALVGADVFIGVSAPGVLNGKMVATMNSGSIIFAMANPTPEIFPEEALGAGAAVVGTGRSDYPNQVNNVLVFPGIFRGALDVRAKDITEEMKLVAAHAIAGIISAEELNAEYIIPKVLDPRVAAIVAAAVAEAAIKSGNSRLYRDL
ncbi:NAD(P)-dependent malic enzyme [Desulfosporosinus nitroreducens]|uniref:NAD-dependent malic enzyme n=1 Tax=Desulfosporosinus nitroreducens TaxID=2018668 RepID=A0ABT8QU57_9FIRM|nr:malic enzyme-like NAD(P)-binding protein [Desulfosporosinus nitroreducens]MCO1601027.1 NAD-dependent malic enzyme [Desulfosporosinus nitroreducens]MDO0824855.1 NAD-dependent malic enzyme [Desulfosporosinus nitroreducens]